MYALWVGKGAAGFSKLVLLCNLILDFKLFSLFASVFLPSLLATVESVPFWVQETIESAFDQIKVKLI